MAYPAMPITDRFAAAIRPDTFGTGCWVWGGTVCKNNGYGWFFISKKLGKKKAGSAHKTAWLLHRGEVPPGLFVCHACHNRLCVNPRHLYLGDAKTNINDSVELMTRHWNRRDDLPMGVRKYGKNFHAYRYGKKIGIYSTSDEASSAYLAARVERGIRL